MAGNLIGELTAVVTFPGALPPMPAVARILARHDRATLAAFIAVAIDLIDTMDGDPEAEAITWTEALEARKQDATLPDDSEAAGDEADAAWIEWQMMRDTQKRGANRTAGHEDDESDDPDTGIEDAPLGFDPEEDMCLAGDDGCAPLYRQGDLWWGSLWEDGDQEDSRQPAETLNPTG